jgi:drug/metabolite transporter (DMT)-like permease
LNATTPLFSVVLTHFLTTDDRMTVNRVAGVLLGILGVAVLVGLDVIGDAGGGTWGKVACLGASLTYALAGLWGRRLRSHPPLLNATGQVTSSAFVMSFLVIGIDQPWHLQSVSGVSIVALLALGVFSTAIGYMIFFKLLSMAGATNTLLVTLIIPASALVMGWLLLDETIGVADVVGMALIGSGLLAIDGRIPRRVRSLVVQSDPVSASVKSGG